VKQHISTSGAENSSTKILPVGTTIVTARGTVGKLALVGTPMAMNQSCYGIRGINGDAYWTYFLCRRVVSDLQQRTHGSVFDTITRSTFASLQVVSPPANLISAFDGVVGSILSKIKANLTNNRDLISLRDSLLPKLISGELRVGDADSSLKEAV
jgi:type I restriction enzyme, S subunit